MKYIQGRAIESIGIKNAIENAAVNASSCEFLELLLNYIENKSICQRMTYFVIEPLLFVLRHSIDNKDFVMEIQLLSLLKSILMQRSFKDSGSNDKSLVEKRKQVLSLLSKEMFIPNLLRGLITPFPYVRVQFINFFSACVPILSELIGHPILTDCVQSILKAYFKIIRLLDIEDEQGQEDGIEFDFLPDDVSNVQYVANQPTKLSNFICNFNFINFFLKYVKRLLVILNSKLQLIRKTIFQVILLIKIVVKILFQKDNKINTKFYLF